MKISEDNYFDWLVRKLGDWFVLFYFIFYLFIYLFIYLLVFLPFLGPLPRAYGGSQARDPIGAIATVLPQSHSNAGSEPCLQPTPQLMVMLDP